MADRKILIVEDDPAITAGLTEFLRSENFSVLTCGDGATAVSVALESDPDLVLLDIGLPSVGGFDVCRDLRAHGFSSPILIMTSRGELVDKVMGLESGADDYITKPFELRELLARIRAHVRRSAERRVDRGTTPMRHLLAVLFSDIEGYSAMMHHDERKGLELLRRHNALMDRLVAAAGGRVVEIVGDAYLVTFESAQDAIRCALEAQQALAPNAETGAFDGAIPVRIGIHVGDVIEVDGGIKGDVVNIARRVQELAVPGSVFVTSAAVTSTRATDVRFEPLGIHQLRNIEQPVEIFRAERWTPGHS